MMTKCPLCKTGRLQATTVSHRVNVGDREFRVTIPATVCAACAEDFVSDETMRRLELSVAARLAAIGDASGEAFRYMRKALGLKAAELGKLLALRPETISRWETGRAPVDRGALAALAAAVNDALAGRSDTLDVLRALGGPARGPKRLEIHLEE
jgi:putative zinc finger/helix-turn-helix YgiT family protein